MKPRVVRIVEYALLASIIYFVLLAVNGCKPKPEAVADPAAVATEPAAIVPARTPVLVVTPNTSTFRATIRRGGSAKLTVNGAEIARIYDVTTDSKLVLEMTRVEAP